MAIPKVTFTARYTPKKDDYVLLPFKNGRTACFDKKALPDALRKAAKAPGNEGEAALVFVGKVGGASVKACAVRLDMPNLTPSLAVKKAVSDALTAAGKAHAARVVVWLDRAQDALDALEGAELGGYRYDEFLSEKTKPLPVFIVGPALSAADSKNARERRTVHECVNFARDVLNGPPNEVHPQTLAPKFTRMGRASGLKVSVWNESKLKQEKCGGILGVGQGAKSKPRLVVGEYHPRGAKKHLCLVGKGVTFDSGGYCLKPPNSQVGMKYDMAGAAMMWAAACAIARLKMPIRITVLTPLVENSISGEAYHTTSILRTRSGRTVEVMNTDAEGRLILADALTIGAEKKPDWIIDAATLTGAVVVGLGEDIAGLFGTDASFTKHMMQAGADVDERFWELPLHLPYKEQLKTTIADCKNIGGKWGGPVTAALFLHQWIPEGMKWIHADVAGPCVKEEPLDFLGKGSKGFGVKTVVQLAERLV